jgi:hypothetical protein
VLSDAYGNHVSVGKRLGTVYIDTIYDDDTALLKRGDPMTDEYTKDQALALAEAIRQAAETLD